jgi:hypothetical protein
LAAWLRREFAVNVLPLLIRVSAVLSRFEVIHSHCEVPLSLKREFGMTK